MARFGVCVLICLCLLVWPAESRADRRQQLSKLASEKTGGQGEGGGGSVTFSLGSFQVSGYKEFNHLNTRRGTRQLKTKLSDNEEENEVNGRRAKPSTSTLGGSMFPDGQYFTEISIGTPPQPFRVQVETAGDFLWVNCAPCIQCNPASPNCPFRNSASSTNKAIYCNDKECVDLERDGYGHCGNCSIQELAYFNKCPNKSSDGDRCYYATYYEDGSSSFGTFRQDLLHLPAAKDDENHAVNLPFGCGRYQTGLLFKDPFRASFVDGILGLGRGTYGLPSVLANNGYKKVFAHCLGGGSGGGSLTFGEPQGINDKDVEYTPFTHGESPLKYYVDFNDVSVGKTRLDVLNGSCKARGALIDSGAAVTRLPPDAYEVIMREIMDQAKIEFNKTLSKEMTFTCFSGRLKKGADDAEEVNKVLPTITLHLGDIDVEIRPSDYTLRWKPEEGRLRPCVFLMPDEQCVIGVSVMRNYLVIYDMENSSDGGLGRLGWKRSDCETGRGTIVDSPQVQSSSCP